MRHIILASTAVGLVISCALLTPAERTKLLADDKVAIDLTGATCAPLEAVGLSPWVNVVCNLAQGAEAFVGQELTADAGQTPPTVTQQVRVKVPIATLPDFLAKHPVPRDAGTKG